MTFPSRLVITTEKGFIEQKAQTSIEYWSSQISSVVKSIAKYSKNWGSPVLRRYSQVQSIPSTLLYSFFWWGFSGGYGTPTAIIPRKLADMNPFPPIFLSTLRVEYRVHSCNILRVITLKPRVSPE